MEFLQSLSESKLFPSQASLDRKSDADVAELAYYYLLVLRIFRLESHTETMAKRYAKRTSEWPSFEKWRASATDLYLILHRLNHIDHPSKGKAPFPVDLAQIERWLEAEGRGQHSNSLARRIFVTLDFGLKIKGTSAKAMRRIVMDWDEQSVRQKAITLRKLYQWFHNAAPRSDLIKDLKRLAEDYAHQDDKLEETVVTPPRSFLAYLDRKNTESLYEFELSKQTDWIERNDQEWRATFTVGDQQFLLVMQKMKRSPPPSGDATNKLRLPVTGVIFDFALITPEVDPRADVETLKNQVRDDNTGEQRFNARTVYSHVLSAAIEYIRAEKPAFVFVQGRQGEKIDLYHSMAKFLKPLMTREGYTALRAVNEWIIFWHERFKVSDYVEKSYS